MLWGPLATFCPVEEDLRCWRKTWLWLSADAGVPGVATGSVWPPFHVDGVTAVSTLAACGNLNRDIYKHGTGPPLGEAGLSCQRASSGTALWQCPPCSGGPRGPASLVLAPGQPPALYNMLVLSRCLQTPSAAGLHE